MKGLAANPILCAVLLALFALPVAIAPVSGQGLITDSPLLPPDGAYTNPDDFHAYSAAGIFLDAPAHHSFTNVVRTPEGSNELESFNSVFDAFEIGIGLGPITLTGPVTVRAYDRLSSTTGTFDTEILFMDLSGFYGVPINVRESPFLQSMGQTVITDLGGGLYHIDSFFDVFTELSVDGGMSWYPCDGPTRMFLIPEPATLLLTGLAALAVFARRP